jgi:hypothetical protein
MIEQSGALIETLTGTLSKLQAGERIWFWFSPQAKEPYPPILLQSFADDPGMDKLQEDAANVPLPRGAIQCIGAGSVSEHGTLQFGTPLASMEMLKTLGAFANNKLDEYPQMAHFQGARFLVIDKGCVREIFEDETLWASMPTPIIPGTLSETAQRLETLKTGESAWFWMTAAGPGNSPFLSIQDRASDPDGVKFAETVATIRRRISGEGMAIRGTLNVRDEWTAMSTSADSTQGWQDLLTALLSTSAAKHPALNRLRDVRMIRMEGDKVVQIEELTATETDAPRADLSEQKTVISKLAKDQSGWFWLCTTDDGSPPTLLLNFERDELKRKIPTIPGGRSVNGMLRLSRTGPVFVVRNPYDNFIPVIHQWVDAHSEAWPFVEMLRSAEVVLKNTSNKKSN